MDTATTTALVAIDVDRLSVASVDACPVSFDWQARLGDDLDGWTAYECFACGQCGRTVVTVGHFGAVYCDHRPHAESDDLSVAGTEDAEHVGCAEGPMMNSAWPIDIGGDCTGAAAQLAHLPLAVVDMESATYLALTGGGMDLSWEIAEAYMRCGNLPPFALSLPVMAGKGREPDWSVIVDACERSAVVLAGWAGRRRDDLARLRRQLGHDAGA